MKTKLSVSRSSVGPPGFSTNEAPVTPARAFENAVIRPRTLPATGAWRGAVATDLVTRP